MKGCRSCGHWQNTGEELDREDPHTSGQKVTMGQCKRYAPRPVVRDLKVSAKKIGFDFPLSPSDGWCGEYDPCFD